MRYKAVIFDLDGTLLDTILDLALSVNAVLQRKGFREHPPEAYRYYIGDGIEMLVHRAFPDGSIDEENLPILVNAVKEEYGRRWANHTKPYPGVPELLSYLEDRQIPKAVFSNKPDEHTQKTVNAFLFRWTFAAVYGVKMGMPRKPDPQGVLLIAQQMRLEPRYIVYVGDTDTDMHAAVAAGMFPVGALWGYRSATELRDAGAQLLAETPAVVANLFNDQ
ncbi:MAG TPA: HAD family hydrolase [Candidatus Limnocylindrales bacterium]|nr:HAD family hydrolase [Candidatus Limnocylindrales bacterium]